MKPRHLVFTHLNDAVADARRLQQSGYTKTADWNLEQNLQHLIKTFKMSTDGIDWGLPRFIRPIIRWRMMPKVRTGDSQAIGLKAKSPPSLLPGPERSIESVLSEFEQLAAVMESPETRFIDAHPVFGKIDHDDWRWAHRWHSAHHLSHLIPNS